MRILVFGASGMVGRALRPMRVAAGDTLVAVSRQPRTAQAGLDWHRGTLPADVPALPACEAIVSLGPLDHFVAWLATADLRHRPRIVALSSMSAESKQASPLAAERDVAARLRAAETRLAQVAGDHDLAWTVLRATLIYGEGDEGGLDGLARRASRWRIFPLPAGRGLRQPIHARDLAAAVDAVLHGDGAADGCVLPAGGGERLSATAMFRRVRAALPRWTLPLPVPRALLRLAARCVPRWRGAIARLDSDLVADNRQLEARLGVHPGPFRPGADRS